ncbi:MAG: gliding motility lipoprotein GldH [Muribaculaceae bacterium]|nr:gliding motility lipoprotein GldH [Muribaculaceae bacterium]
MAKLLSVVAVIVATLITVSCGQQRESGTFHAVDASGWLYGDTLFYNLEPMDSDSIWHGDIAVAVRHTAAYPYSNIWMELGYNPTDNLSPDTLNILLADAFGNWQGRGLGLSFQRVDTVLHNLTLKTPTTLSLRHIMRSDRLPDVEQIGLIFISNDK